MQFETAAFTVAQRRLPAFFRLFQSGRYPSSSGSAGLRQPNDEALFHALNVVWVHAFM